MHAYNLMAAVAHPWDMFFSLGALVQPQCLALQRFDVPGAGIRGSLPPAQKGEVGKDWGRG